jgi:hypothetical protein
MYGGDLENEPIFCENPNRRLLRQAGNPSSGIGQRGHSNCRRMTITDWLNFAMLLCAAIGSMAFGILAAYAILRVGFWFIRPHPRPAPVKAPQPEAASTL